MKQSYKIPESLDANYFDVEIAMKTKDGMGPLRIHSIFLPHIQGRGGHLFNWAVISL